MSQPNFIVIYCDDLGYGDLGCFGSDVMKTPYLDQLAEEGVRFTNWYSNSPVCSPSRAALLTGRYPANAGVTGILPGKRGTAGLPQDKKTLAAMLKPLGYKTAMFGKWHLGVTEENSPNAHGFDQFYGFMAGCVDYYSHIFYWGQAGGVNPVHDLWNNDEEVWRDGEYLTEVISEHAVEFIEKNQEDPFFMYVPYNAPHYPMHAPQKYVDRFPDLPWDRQIMAAMMAAVDDGVGDIMDALKRTGQYENTVIFFSSDNGPSTESRNWLDGTEDEYYGGTAGILRGHKGSLFDGGTREPAILSYPALIPAGQVCDEVGVMMDIVPTFLELADGAVPEGIDGLSVVPMLTKQAKSPHQQVFWENRDQRAVREGKWKLVLNGKIDFKRTQPDEVHLSDLDADPGERINLKDQYPDIANRLQADVKEWYSNLEVYKK